MNEPAHSPVTDAAADLHELRERARLIRDCPYLTPAARDQMRREVAAAITQAAVRFQRVSATAAASPLANPSRKGRYRRW